MRSVTNRLASSEADYLRRLVLDPAALGNGERERTVLPDQRLDAASAAVPFRKAQELGPSSG